MFRFIIPTRSWGNCVDNNNVATFRCVPVILQNIINILIIFAGLAALFFFVWGSIKLIMSQGDPQKLDSGRKTIIYAVVGLVFILFSFAILGLINKFTGVNQIPH